MTKVTNFYGVEIDMDAAMIVADPEICEDMNAEGCFDDPQDYIIEYSKRHADKFSEEFAPFYGNAH